MARRAFPVLEQQICLEAVVSHGRLIAKRLVTTRTHAIADILIAHPVDGIPRILSQLFPLCGTAHAAAGGAAIEAALAIEVSPAQHAFRDLMLLTEHGAALAWRILMEWPPLLGEPANTRACADVRRAVAVINAVAGRDQ